MYYVPVQPQELFSTGLGSSSVSLSKIANPKGWPMVSPEREKPLKVLLYIEKLPPLTHAKAMISQHKLI